MPGVRERTWFGSKVWHQHLPTVLQDIRQGHWLREVPLNVTSEGREKGGALTTL